MRTNLLHRDAKLPCQTYVILLQPPRPAHGHIKNKNEVSPQIFVDISLRY